MMEALTALSSFCKTQRKKLIAVKKQKEKIEKEKQKKQKQKEKEKERERSSGATMASAHDAGVADALAEVLVAGVVREAAELVLHRLRQGRLVDVRVLRLLARELGIEVGRIQHRFLHTENTCVRQGMSTI